MIALSWGIRVLLLAVIVLSLVTGAVAQLIMWLLVFVFFEGINDDSNHRGNPVGRV